MCNLQNKPLSISTGWGAIVDLPDTSSIFGVCKFSEWCFILKNSLIGNAENFKLVLG